MKLTRKQKALALKFLSTVKREIQSAPELTPLRPKPLRQTEFEFLSPPEPTPLRPTPLWPTKFGMLTPGQVCDLANLITDCMRDAQGVIPPADLDLLCDRVTSMLDIFGWLTPPEIATCLLWSEGKWTIKIPDEAT